MGEVKKDDIVKIKLEVTEIDKEELNIELQQTFKNYLTSLKKPVDSAK